MLFALSEEVKTFRFGSGFALRADSRSIFGSDNKNQECSFVFAKSVWADESGTIQTTRTNGVYK